MTRLTIKKSLNHSLGRQAGLSLIELMIASVIGLVILGGAVTIFSGNSASSSMSSGMARLQDSGRVALDIITNSARMAGYQGCKSDVKDPPSVIANVAPEIDIPNTAIWGSEYINNLWTTARPPELLNIANIVKEGTDVIYLQHASGRSTTLRAPMTNTTNPIQLVSNPDQLAAGDLMIISDCELADIFRATDANTTNGITTIGHAASTNSQANFSKMYLGTGNMDTTPMRVMRFEANAYFVSDSGRDTPGGDPVYSLFALDTTQSPIGNPTELIEGVENLQILYGELMPVTGDIRYVVANNVGDWTAVVSVQIGMLIATSDYAGGSNDDRIYNIAGTAIGPTGDNAHAGDRRLRASFNSTIRLRNRGLTPLN